MHAFLFIHFQTRRGGSRGEGSHEHQNIVQRGSGRIYVLETSTVSVNWGINSSKLIWYFGEDDGGETKAVQTNEADFILSWNWHSLELTHFHYASLKSHMSESVSESDRRSGMGALFFFPCLPLFGILFAFGVVSVSSWSVSMFSVVSAGFSGSCVCVSLWYSLNLSYFLSPPFLVWLFPLPDVLGDLGFLTALHQTPKSMLADKVPMQVVIKLKEELNLV